MSLPKLYQGRLCSAALFLFSAAAVVHACFVHRASGALPSSAPSLSSADDTLELSGLERKFQSVARKAAPSVVAISASLSKAQQDGELQSDALNGEKLESILDRGVRIVGSGLVIDTDGYILTNEHVVGESEQIWVTTDAGTVHPALVVGSDPRLDLAVLKIPARNLVPVKFASPAHLQRGMWTIALGNPYGMATAGQMCMSVGVISAIERNLPRLASKQNRVYSGLIQTTAQINPGNSGGPLLNLDGEVIGINTAVILPQRQVNGIGFALPITPRLLDIARDLREGREIVHAYVGVMVITPTARERQLAGIPVSHGGARIESIESNSPAAASNLRIDDIVVAINDERVTSSDQFVRHLGEVSVNRPATLEVYRGGESLMVSVTPTRRPMPAVAVNQQTQRLRWRGMLLGPLPANWQATDKQPAGGLVVLAMDPQSPAVRDGVKAGSIITAVAGKAVKTVVELQQVINDTAPEQLAIQCAASSQAVASTGPP